MQLTDDVSIKKVALLTEGFESCDDEVATIVRETAQMITSKGATVVEVSLPIHRDSKALQTGEK